jgi:hypothetical protein
MTLVSFRNNLLLLMIGLYLLLDYGFVQVRLPAGPATGIPLGEMVLLFFFITINYEKLLARLSETVFLVPFMIWWGLGISRAFADTYVYGFWALRDANHVIESLFLVAGFAFAALPEQLERFFRWLRYILVFICIYAMGFPAKGFLKTLSPKLISGTGHEASLLFNYINTSGLLLLAAVNCFLISHAKKVYYFFIGTFLLGFSMLAFQGRTIYLQIIAIFLASSLYRKGLLFKEIISVLVLISFVAIIPLIGLHFRGRLGQEVSLDFLVNHFFTFAGVKSEGLEGAAEGVPQRLEWWLNLYKRWTSDTSTFIFGLGYGFPLVDFRYYHDIAVREPHNSYISILARLGLSGGLAFIWMHILLVRIWHHTYRACQRMHWQEWEKRLFTLMIFFILVWVYAIGEDALEKPYVTIPYYFFWGIVLRINWHLKYQYFGYFLTDRGSHMRLHSGSMWRLNPIPTLTGK